MKILPFLPEHFVTLSHHLKRGLPVIVPTETCYGFSGDIFSISVKTRVEEIKGRQQKPFLILVNTLEQMSEYATIDPKQKNTVTNLANEKPTSFLFPKSKTFPAKYFPDFPEIGIRLCGYKPLQGFLNFFQSPIFSTSANISGYPEIYAPELIKKNFGNIPDLLFMDAGTLTKNPPSRIIRMKGSNDIEVLRK